MIVTYWMTLAIFLGYAHQILYRVSHHDLMINPIAILYAQSLLGLIFLQIVIAIGRKNQPDFMRMKGKYFLQFGVRGVLAVIGHICFIRAITQLPFLALTLTSCLGMIVTSVGSMFFIEKTFSMRKVLALLSALLGVLLSQSTSLRECSDLVFLSTPTVLAISSTICFSGSSLLTKSLTHSYSSFDIVYYLMLSMSILSAGALAFLDHSALIFYGDTRWFAIAGILAMIYICLHGAITYSYASADLSWITLLKTLKIPISAQIDMLIYGYTLSLEEYAGAALIVAAVVVHDLKSRTQIFPQRIKRLAFHTRVLS